MDPFSIAAGIAAVGGLIANIFTTERSNEKQEELWQKNNQYNTPANQMARLRQAGINPALSVAHGMVTSGTSDSPAAYTPLDIQADTSNVAQSFNNMATQRREERLARSQETLNNAQADNQNIRNMTQLWRDFTEITNMIKSGNLTDEQAHLARQQASDIFKKLQYADRLYEGEIGVRESEGRKNRAEARHQEALADYQEIVNRFAPQQQEKALKVLDAHYDSLMAAAYASNQAGLDSAADAALKDLQGQGVVIDNETKKGLKRHLIRKARFDANMTRDENERKWLKSYHEAHGKAGEWYISAGGVVYSNEGYTRAMRENRLDD